MSNFTESSKECETIQEDLAELALGILAGRRRSEVLDHVESCPRCSSELEQLSIAADTVLQLAPEAEPPLGFELRLAEKRQSANGVRQSKRFRRASVLTAAAVLVGVLGFGVGTLATSNNSNGLRLPETANLIAGNLDSHGQVLGEALVSSGSPAWMFMTIDSGTWSGVVWCEVTLAGGKVETIGRFSLADGYGAWGAPLTARASQVRAARVVTANGTILASAVLRA